MKMQPYQEKLIGKQSVGKKGTVLVKLELKMCVQWALKHSIPLNTRMIFKFFSIKHENDHWQIWVATQISFPMARQVQWRFCLNRPFSSILAYWVKNTKSFSLQSYKYSTVIQLLIYWKFQFLYSPDIKSKKKFQRWISNYIF